MKKGSSRPSIKPVKPADRRFIPVIRAIHDAAAVLECRCFLAGSTARDLLLVSIHGLRGGRATMDVDFGVAVESWAQFTQLKDRLTSGGEFEAVPRIEHRLRYRPTHTPVDLVPFGGVEDPARSVAWPPRRNIVLNVAGFEEAWASSLAVDIAEDLTIRVVSIPGLAVLKLLSWIDRRNSTTKDADDLFALFRSYADAGNMDRLYDMEAALLEANGFDVDLAGAELLGRDAADVCSEMTLAQLTEVVGSEDLMERLAMHIGRSAATADPERATRTVEAFARGFTNHT